MLFCQQCDIALSLTLRNGSDAPDTAFNKMYDVQTFSSWNAGMLIKMLCL